MSTPPRKNGLRKDQRPVTEADYDEVRRLHAQGLGRNAIAREMGRGPRTVSVIAAELGLDFDRSMTAEATRARKADLEERRVLLAEALQGDAERLTEQLWQRAKVFNIGGKNNTYTDHDVDEPPAEAKKNLMAAAGIAVEKSLKLVPLDREDLEGLAAVDAWLRGMMPDQQ
ncbi:helix-turn-helix domain-containing protein [Streptomyces lavenduligriseus]|uniref:Helix-turn-helix domain-containing protein n=1 Tax=Streptomyces lavenduligriseus TaxID=67315 RepID=A0ABT0NUL3_9ACTN|nr:helix-turn-helix domain-containing protein [Streptomyces lavenduligriseus]MCL3994438.1 helix-turn-helix domain-containing protein [Streptomyces lavenduligriseus]